MKREGATTTKHTSVFEIELKMCGIKNQINATVITKRKLPFNRCREGEKDGDLIYLRLCQK